MQFYNILIKNHAICNILSFISFILKGHRTHGDSMKKRDIHIYQCKRMHHILAHDVYDEWGF